MLQVPRTRDQNPHVLMPSSHIYQPQGWAPEHGGKYGAGPPPDGLTTHAHRGAGLGEGAAQRRPSASQLPVAEPVWGAPQPQASYFICLLPLKPHNTLEGEYYYPLIWMKKPSPVIFQLFVLAAESFLEGKSYMEPQVNQATSGMNPLA